MRPRAPLVLLVMVVWLSWGAEARAADFGLLDVGPSTSGGTHYLATWGEPAKRCAFHIVTAKPDQGEGGVQTASVELRRHPHADCTALLDTLAAEAGAGATRPAAARAAGGISGSLVLRVRDQMPAPPGRASLAGEMTLAGAAGALTIGLDPRAGKGALSATRAPGTAAVLSELAKLLLPDAPAVMKGKPWEELSQGEKKRLMKQIVLPRMREVWREMDPVRYANIDCTLCHGRRAQQGRFQMPNPDLPALDFANKLSKERAEKPALTRFMFKHVVPEMTLALGVRPFDVKSGQGFGCQRCHRVVN
jgi:hypothetical protein